MAKIIVNADSARAYRRRPPDRFGSAVVLCAAALSPWESVVTVGEVIPKNYRGDTLIARVRWSRPNHSLGK